MGLISLTLELMTDGLDEVVLFRKQAFLYHLHELVYAKWSHRLHRLHS